MYNLLIKIISDIMEYKVKYKNIVKGEFVSRPNRFIAKVIIGGEEHTVHVKNTGRCKEFLIKGATVYLEKSDNTSRKTQYDMVAVEKITDRGVILINFDSMVANDAVFDFLKSGKLFSKDAVIKREVTFGNSRFDFYIEDGVRKAFLEVKGVTLEFDGVAYFPDAPTERGIKHINELVKSIEEGYEAYIIFVVQMKGVHLFKPNDETHKAFGNALRNAHKCGVNVLAVDCEITPDSIVIENYINVELCESL